MSASLLCLWSKRWIISFFVLSMIIQFVANGTGVETGVKSFFATVLLQVIIVKSIDYFNGAECLSIEKNKLQRLINLKDAQIEMKKYN